MRILIVYYSMTGHVFRLARAVAQGVGEVEGTEVSLKTVEELLPKEVIEKKPAIKKAKEEQKDIPIATNEDLIQADAVLFGSPTRYGNMCAQLRNFLDQTGPIWAKGQLAGKPAGVFCSTGTMHGGQETTIISTMLTLLHHGMIIVGIPYTEQKLSTTTRGGTPYGASSVSGPKGDQFPNEDELYLAKALGKRVAEVAKKLKGK